MIVRIGTIPEYKTWRARLARWLRGMANQCDRATVVILATDNAGLKAQCIQGCTRMFLQAQAMEFAQEHADDIRSMEMAQALQEWEPGRREMQ